MGWRTILIFLLGAGGLARAAELPALANGSMGEGGAAPAGWTLTRPKEGSTAELTRDTARFVRGPASLCLSVTGEVGQATCELPAAAGQRFVVRGFLRSTGKESGLNGYQLAVHAQDAAWKQVLWKDVWLENFFIQGRTPTEWTPFAAEVSVPPEGVHVRLLLLVKGSGRVWLDELEIAPPGARPPTLPRPAADRPQQARPRVTHEPEDPAVVGVCAVAPDILCVTIQAQRVQQAPQVAYEPKPGDEVRESGEEVLAYQHGKIERTKKDLAVFRTVGGKEERLGALAVNAGMLWPSEKLFGRPLDEARLAEPASYSISSSDDPAYAKPAAPLRVDRKSKPTDLDVGNKWPVRYWLYLKLPRPLQEGRSYVVRFPGVNTRRPQVAYKHDTRKVQTEALHVTQIGYRPGDPYKRAYVSTWLGTGGALACDATGFLLLDEATGEPVHEGKLALGLAADRPEHLKEEKNYAQTDVYYADFSDFRRPGTYRVCVPGLGVSGPFRIARDAWTDAFQVSMKGILHQRSGIALGPPFTTYVRPRPMFPGDGVKVLGLDITTWDGEAAAVNEAFGRLLGPSLDASGLALQPDAWGGYMDAGDWDRRSGHLRVGYLLMELLDLFPDYYGKLKLALPPDEAGDGLPDVLNEALWGLDLYRRLQRPDGAVGGGIESTAHPRAGECSWQESLLIGAFAPDPESSYHYAACAAKAARLLATHDKPLAARYRESALRAWQWADANGREMASEHGKEAPTRRMRALAAAELYHLTGEKAYDSAFRDAILAGDEPFDAERDAWFAYAILPDDLADVDLKQRAIDGYRMLGEAALKFSQGNAFSIATDVPGLPMIGFVGYWSTPGMSVAPGLPRAHYLTGDERYLAGAVASCNFSAGANPMNMTMTVGVGRDYPRAPLHIDSRRSGQEAPAGITVYGPSDPAMTGGAYDWAHTYILKTTMTPESHTWPAEEFYVDVYKWPVMNEYTVPQTMAVTAYTWGYLAARK